MGLFDEMPEMSGSEGLGMFAEMFAEMLGRRDGPVSREDIARELGATKETKRPRHLMAELALSKLQASEEIGMEKTERMLTAFFIQEGDLVKEIEELKENRKELQTRLVESQESSRDLQKEIARWKAAIEVGNAQSEQQEEIIKGLEGDVRDMLENMEAQAATFDSIEVAIKDAKQHKGNDEILATIADILKTKSSKQGEESVSKKEVGEELASE